MATQKFGKHHIKNARANFEPLLDFMWELEATDESKGVIQAVTSLKRILPLANSVNLGNSNGASITTEFWGTTTDHASVVESDGKLTITFEESARLDVFYTRELFARANFDYQMASGIDPNAGGSVAHDTDELWFTLNVYPLTRSGFRIRRTPYDEEVVFGHFNAVAYESADEVQLSYESAQGVKPTITFRYGHFMLKSEKYDRDIEVKEIDPNIEARRGQK